MDKKMIYGALFSVFIVAGLVTFRDHIGLVWATPEKVATVEKKVASQEEHDAKQQETLDTLKELYKAEQIQAKADDQVRAAQIEALKSIVENSKKR